MHAVEEVSTELLKYLSEEELARLDILLSGNPVGVLTFKEFIDRVRVGYIWHPHCVCVAAVLQKVADREIENLIITAPPQVGKSELASRLFPAYWLYLYPHLWVGLVSYAAALATGLSRNARTNYRSVGRKLNEESATAAHWETQSGGGMWAAGIGGPSTGKGFSLGIIDDSVKDAEEARSETIGQRNWDWYRSVFVTRRAKGAARILMHTRWPGPADLIGRVLEAESGAEIPERWHILRLDAEHDTDKSDVPATCTIEPDPRAEGEPLYPDKLPKEELAKLRSTLGPFWYSALYQQRPVAREGNMFPREKATIVAAAPANARRVRYWDKAGSAGTGAFTAGVRMSRGPDGLIYVEDVQRKQYSALARRQLMKQTAELDGTGVHIWIEQEPGSGGKESAETSVIDLAGYVVRTETATGDKVVRADPYAAQWQAGNVRLVRGDWNKPYLDELESFPNGKFKDQVDGSSGAFNKLVLVKTGGIMFV